MPAEVAYSCIVLLFLCFRVRVLAEAEDRMREKEAKLEAIAGNFVDPQAMAR